MGDVGLALMEHLRSRNRPPLVFGEIAIAGSYASKGRLDVVALTIGSGYKTSMLDGYEVKISKSDFYRDVDADKWRQYIDCKLLRRMFFAFPTGLVPIKDVPPECGVMCLSPEGRWTVVRRAPTHDVAPQLPPDVLLRLLYRDNGEQPEKLPRRVETIRRYAEMDDDTLAQTIGWRATRAINDILTRENRIALREQDLERQREAFQQQRQAASEMLPVIEAIMSILQVARTGLDVKTDYGRERAEASRSALIELAEQLTAAQTAAHQKILSA